MSVAGGFRQEEKPHIGLRFNEIVPPDIFLSHCSTWRKGASWRMIGRVFFFPVGFIRRLYPYLSFHDFNERGDGFWGEIKLDPGCFKEFGQGARTPERQRFFVIS